MNAKKALLIFGCFFLFFGLKAQVSIPFYYNWAPNGTDDYVRASDGVTFTSGEQYLVVGGGVGVGGCIQRGILDGDVFDTLGNVHPDQQLYKTECWGGGGPSTITVEVPVPNGSYDIVYHATEFYYGVQEEEGVCKRVFDMVAENEIIFADFDIWGQVGHQVGLAFPIHDIAVADGSLTLSGVATSNNPLICALEIYPAGTLSDARKLKSTAKASQDVFLCEGASPSFEIEDPFPGDVEVRTLEIDRQDGNGWVVIANDTTFILADNFVTIVNASLDYSGYTFRTSVNYGCTESYSEDYIVTIDAGGTNGCSGAHCYNGVQDGDEEGVDCGGSCFGEICVGTSPTDPTDTLPPAHCFNGAQDGDETFIDCGGSCISCDSVVVSPTDTADSIVSGVHIITPKISVHPNPTSGQFEIDGTFDSAIVYDIHGSIIIKETSSNRLKIHDNGLYYVKITSDNGNIVIPILVE